MANFNPNLNGKVGKRTTSFKQLKQIHDAVAKKFFNFTNASQNSFTILFVFVFFSLCF
jgi:hypothetical protein